MSQQVKVGIIGTGNISGAYLRACRFFKILEVVAVADLNPERARMKAEEFDVPKALTVTELLADDDIDIVINLTIPAVHAEVSTAILEAGKNVYSEKPLAIEREEGRRVLELAAEKGLFVGCAPDTFLGGGLQTCRHAIDEGMIGRPVAATAFMMGHGPESWHPDPIFFYQQGAGPLFDMGPYYLTALIHLMGPIRSVAGSAVISLPERTVTSQPLAGTVIRPETPTHITGLLDFASGAVGSLTTSFDVWGSEHPRIEIYGTEGTLSVPDPNTFGGPVRVRLAGDKEWKELPFTHAYTENSRGLGVADMAHAMRSSRPHRASGELAYHVLDLMQGILEAAQARQYLDIESRVERPAPFPTGMPDGVLDGNDGTADARYIQEA
jgi:predicted dehydrogenase